MLGQWNLKSCLQVITMFLRPAKTAKTGQNFFKDRPEEGSECNKNVKNISIMFPYSILNKMIYDNIYFFISMWCRSTF